MQRSLHKSPKGQHSEICTVVWIHVLTLLNESLVSGCAWVVSFYNTLVIWWINSFLSPVSGSTEWWHQKTSKNHRWKPRPEIGIWSGDSLVGSRPVLTPDGVRVKLNYVRHLVGFAETRGSSVVGIFPTTTRHVTTFGIRKIQSVVWILGKKENIFFLFNRQSKLLNYVI